MYLFPAADGTTKCPVWSIKICPVICFASANINPVGLCLSGSGMSSGIGWFGAVGLCCWSVIACDLAGDVSSSAGGVGSPSPFPSTIVLCVVRSTSVMSGGITWGRMVFTVGLFLILVDRKFALWAHMCPIAEARWFGGYFRRCFVVIVGNEVKYPRLIASARVDKAGEKRDLEVNSTLSAIVGASMTAFNE